MENHYIFLETKQYQTEVQKWLEALKRQENATVLFVPKTDRLIRMAHLINDRQTIDGVLGSFDKFIFLRIAFDPSEVNELQDITLRITEQLNSSKVPYKSGTFEEWIKYISSNSLTLILVLPEAEGYLTGENKHVLSLVSILNEHYSPLVRILSFFETNFTHPSYSLYMPSSTRLYENIFPYPLYPREDTLKFMEMLEKLWDLVLTDKAKEKIIAKCGGHFWLVKQAVREVSSFGDWKIDSEGMMFRIRTVYQSLSTREQEVVKKVITNREDFSHEEGLSLKYLKKMRIIDVLNTCLVGGFADLLLSPRPQSGDIELKENCVYINKVPVDTFFSRQELRVMKLLLERNKQIVSREDIAERMWPGNTQEQYSDWAIDQLIARLRKRLTQLSLSPKLLEVVRGKGYRLKLLHDYL